jgi:hypothetical protein
MFLVAAGDIHLLITFLIDECAKTSKGKPLKESKKPQKKSVAPEVKSSC